MVWALTQSPTSEEKKTVSISLLGGFALEVADDAEVAKVYAVETADGDHRVLDAGIFNSVMNFHVCCFVLSGTKVIYTRFIITFGV